MMSPARPGPVVIAHRGASRAAPENTIEAFHQARALGADWVELDVHLGLDGAVVVHHDAVLPGGRPVASCTTADLPDHVPLLDAALRACAPLGVNVEIKRAAGPGDPASPDPLASAVVAALARRPAGQAVLVSSFDLATIDAVRRLDPSVPTAWLVVVPGPDTLETLLRHGHGALHPHHSVVDAGLVERSHDAGVAVNVWTCDDPDRIALLAGWGVDGICTNVPDVARRVLDAR